MTVLWILIGGKRIQAGEYNRTFAPPPPPMWGGDRNLNITKKWWAQSQYTISALPPSLHFCTPYPFVSYEISVGQVRPIGWEVERCGYNRLRGRALRLEWAREPSAAAREGEGGTKMKGGVGGGQKIQYWENPKWCVPSLI